MNLSLYPQEIAPSNEDVNPQLEELLWKQFEEMRTQDYVKEENIK